MANTIKHQGIVENINGSHLQVRIIQTSACASCSVQGTLYLCGYERETCRCGRCQCRILPARRPCMGDGRTFNGSDGVLFAFIFPFLILIISLFVFMAIWNDELRSALCSLALLVPYYYILWLNKSRMGKKFSFSVRPMN